MKTVTPFGDSLIASVVFHLSVVTVAGYLTPKLVRETKDAGVRVLEFTLAAGSQESTETAPMAGLDNMVVEQARAKDSSEDLYRPDPSLISGTGGSKVLTSGTPGAVYAGISGSHVYFGHFIQLSAGGPRTGMPDEIRKLGVFDVVSLDEDRVIVKYSVPLKGDCKRFVLDQLNPELFSPAEWPGSVVRIDGWRNCARDQSLTEKCNAAVEQGREYTCQVEISQHVNLKNATESGRILMRSWLAIAKNREAFRSQFAGVTKDEL